MSEHRLYTSLLTLSPGLEERLNTGTEEDLIYVASMVSKNNVVLPHLGSSNDSNISSRRVSIQDALTIQSL